MSEPSWLSRNLRRVVVRVLAKAIRAGTSHHLPEMRAAVDKAYPHQSEEWRRDLWREAAEKAQGQ